jgi:hypothetical protein
MWPIYVLSGVAGLVSGYRNIMARRDARLWLTMDDNGFYEETLELWIYVKSDKPYNVVRYRTGLVRKFRRRWDSDSGRSYIGLFNRVCAALSEKVYSKGEPITVWFILRSPVISCCQDLKDATLTINQRIRISRIIREFMHLPREL